jgi:hypothetical protein
MEILLHKNADDADQSRALHYGSTKKQINRPDRTITGIAGTPRQIQ